MSIFNKDCPRCGSKVSVSADSCGCGFSFDPDSLEKAAQDLELAAHDEQMYESYLSARVSQAKSELETAKIFLGREPENPVAQNGVVAAKAELEEAQSDWQAQTAKVKQAKESAKIANRAMSQAKERRERKRKEEEIRLQAQQEAERSRKMAAQAEIDRQAKEQKLAQQKAEKAARLEAEEQLRKQAARSEARRAKEAEIAAKQEVARQMEEASLAAKAAHERQVAMAMALVSRADDDIREAKRFKSGAVESEAPSRPPRPKSSSKSAKAKVIDHPSIAKTKPVSKQIAPPSKTVPATEKVTSRPEKDIPVLTQAASKPDDIAQLNEVPKMAAPRPDLIQKAQQAMKIASALLQRDNAKKKAEQAAARAKKAAEAVAKKAQQSKQATKEFKEAQAAKASNLRPLPNPNAAPTCPHCTAKIKAGRTKCGCGYELAPVGRDSNDLVLNDNDLRLINDTPEISITLLG